MYGTGVGEVLVTPYTTTSLAGGVLVLHTITSSDLPIY